MARIGVLHNELSQGSGAKRSYDSKGVQGESSGFSKDAPGPVFLGCCSDLAALNPGGPWLPPGGVQCGAEATWLRFAIKPVFTFFKQDPTGGSGDGPPTALMLANGVILTAHQFVLVAPTRVPKLCQLVLLNIAPDDANWSNWISTLGTKYGPNNSQQHISCVYLDPVTNKGLAKIGAGSLVQWNTGWVKAPKVCWGVVPCALAPYQLRTMKMRPWSIEADAKFNVGWEFTAYTPTAADVGSAVAQAEAVAQAIPYEPIVVHIRSRGLSAVILDAPSHFGVDGYPTIGIDVLGKVHCK